MAHDHDVVRLQCRREAGLEIGEERGAIRRPINDPRRVDPIDPEIPPEMFSGDFIVLQSSAGEEEDEERCLCVDRDR